MAAEGPQPVKWSFLAGEALTAKQYHFVKQSGGSVVVTTAITDKPLGILQNAPAAGGVAEVCVAGISKLVGGVNLALDDQVGCAINGTGTVAAGTASYQVGRVLEENTAVNGICTVAVNCLNPVLASS